jgi:hypothetical protein
MQILGYNVYHMFECVIVRGKSHMEICEEAVIAQNNRFSGIKRYDRADFDKWFAEYDVRPESTVLNALIMILRFQCLVELPSFLGPAVIEAYAEEPDVKFILVEREPTKWVASLTKTGGNLLKALNGFPLALLKYFDSLLYRFVSLNRIVFWSFTDCKNPGDPDYEVAMHRNYEE